MPDDRVPLKKTANIRHAAKCLAEIGPANSDQAGRFVDWKTSYDRRRTASVGSQCLSCQGVTLPWKFAATQANMLMQGKAN